MFSTKKKNENTQCKLIHDQIFKFYGKIRRDVAERINFVSQVKIE